MRSVQACAVDLQRGDVIVLATGRRLVRRVWDLGPTIIVSHVDPETSEGRRNAYYHRLSLVDLLE